MNENRKTPPSVLLRVVIFVSVFIASFALTIGVLTLNHRRKLQAIDRKIPETNQTIAPARVEGLPATTPVSDDRRMTAPVQAIKLKLVSVDSEETSAEPGSGQNAVDGNPSTYWHTQWQDNGQPPPHEIVIELIPPTLIRGFTYLPRQDSSDHGVIKDYEFFVSDDAKEFREPVRKGSFDSTRNLKTEMFEATKARFIKLKALTEINGLAWTSAAEIGVVQAE